jgi:hypothetical protein
LVPATGAHAGRQGQAGARRGARDSPPPKSIALIALMKIEFAQVRLATQSKEGALGRDMTLSGRVTHTVHPPKSTRRRRLPP